ncbi:diphthamide biosynthesis enzyme Dph2 [Methanomassiliicoccales archaeon LGM-RCC1]|jgi:2-(3-amino-3-carboxypropyl)histidine synthase|nr:diphthamide biosynthesis enzyme Dph2 [Candidatus Methanomethylophilaceae archaeon]WII07060.1 diphthamide biosynthesis enzyme Dph2 [Methanomassiliicoccales archaeon LGM-RCC1]
MFDFRLDDIVAWIRDGGYSSVALQLPEGLKIRATEISEYLSDKTGVDTLIVGLPCYGACDLYDYKGKTDALVHFGHSPIPSQGDDPNVMYIESRSDVTLDDSVMDSLKDLPERIGLLATVQYLGLIPVVKAILEKNGRKVSVGVGDRRIAYPGQVLGCNCSSAEAVIDDVDAFLFIGEGDFHPLAAAFGVNKDIIVLNPVTKEVRNMAETRDRILRKRFAAIQSASNAQSFLVIVCSKVGQNRSAEADRIIEKIRTHGLKAYKAVLEEINPISLMSYRVDAYVNTACPRVAMDDSAKYDRPMLTIPELDIVLGDREWADYEFDQIRP